MGEGEERGATALSNPALARFPEHTRLIGTVILSYPELMMAFSHCVGLAIGLKYDALDALFRIESEKTRVLAGSELAARSMESRGLSQQFDQICQALQGCADIRNAYAHGMIEDENNSLFIADKYPKFDGKEERYKTEITIASLQLQLAYFEYARSCLLHLERTLQGHRGASAFPKKIRPPHVRTPVGKR